MQNATQNDILNEQERAVITEAMRGMTIEQQARTLNVSTAVVRKRRESILEKYYASNMIHAVVLDLYATGHLKKIP